MGSSQPVTRLSLTQNCGLGIAAALADPRAGIPAEVVFDRLEQSTQRV
jgi:hypothetical protein